MKELHKRVNPDQLEAKYGGHRNNLIEHWPPRLPKPYVRKMTSIHEVDESVYYSIIDEN